MASRYDDADDRRRPGHYNDDRPERPKKGCTSVTLILLGVTSSLLFVCCGGCLITGWMMSSTARKALDEADEQYADGNHRWAVKTYKRHFSHAKDKPKALKRIVEYELEQGNTQEARTWVERGIQQKIEVAYGTPSAQKLLADVRREQQERAARLEEEARAEEARRRQRERAAAALKREQERETREKERKEASRKWYEGGTLHKGTMKEWREATRANKLATAADFLGPC